MNRFSRLSLPLLIVLFAVLFSTSLIGQSSSPSSQGSPGSDAFFLDLGIVIEPRTGNEEVNRLVKATPEKVKFFVDKAPSGSVFIATTNELQKTLSRISQKIVNLEYAFQKEVTTMKEENRELRDMIADLLAREPILPPQALVPEKVPELSTEQPPKTIPVVESFTSGSVSSHQEQNQPFNRMLYMNAVFAYQREDYTVALQHFSKVFLGTIDEVTAGNVLYWVADCYYQLGDYGDALNTLGAIKPLFRSDKRDDAIILTGLVYRQMGNEKGAIEAFTNIVRDYPESEYFRLAQMEIRKAER